MLLLLLLVTVAGLLLVVREAFGWRLSSRAQIALAYVSTGLLGLCAVLGVVGIVTASPLLIPMIVLPAVHLTMMSVLVARRKNGWLTRQAAGPDVLALFRDEIDNGVRLGFHRPRIEEVRRAQGPPVNVMIMIGYEHVVYTAQRLGSRRIVSFSSFFDDGKLELDTGNHVAPVAPRAISRVVDGTIVEMLEAHRSDVASLVANGHQVITWHDRDLFEVAEWMHQNHEIEIGSSVFQSIASQLMPRLQILQPVAAR